MRLHLVLCVSLTIYFATTLASDINSSNDCKSDTSLAILRLARQALIKARDLHAEKYGGCDSKCMSFLNAAIRLLGAGTEQLQSLYGSRKANSSMERSGQFPIQIRHEKPMDCTDIMQNGFRRSGIYSVYPRNRVLEHKPIKVFCDMKNTGGGWTVIQRRGKFETQEDFLKNWQEYKKGFGDIKQEFWLGNDYIYALSNQGKYQMRIDLKDSSGKKAFATYDLFYIENENKGYKLHVGNYSGTAGDSMQESNLQPFSTKDKQNPESRTGCASENFGGWWYKNCAKGSLNGLLLPGKEDDSQSVLWYMWRKNQGLDSTEIKIRRRDQLLFV